MKNMRKRAAAALLAVLSLLSVLTVPVFAVSYPMDYTIVYKTDTGTILGSNTGTVNADEIGSLSVVSPAYSGYVLNSSSDAVVSGSMISWTYPPSHYIRSGTGEYTVIYTKAYSVTIQYVTSDGDTLFPSKTISGAAGSSYSVASPFDTSYIAEKMVVSGTFQKSNQNITVVYYPKTYTISYDANGGTGAPASQIKEQGKNISLSTQIPARSGYRFLGWGLSKNSEKVSYASGALYTTNSNLSLYAIWGPGSYTISFNAAGGTGAPIPQTKQHGVDLIIPDKIPSREGYEFYGWATGEIPNFATYYPGSVYSANHSETLYAVWVYPSPSYTVTYDANGGTGAPLPQTKQHGTDLILTNTTPSRPEYVFLGWSTSKTAVSAMYSAGDKYTANSSITLYAVWQKEISGAPIDAEYKIYYYAYGAFGVPETQTKRHGQAIQLSLGAPGKLGYKFLGWATSANATKPSYQPGDYYLTDKNLSLYAVWEKTKIRYRVHYEANGGDGAPDNQTKIEGEALILSKDKPTKDGYQFWGWAKSEDADTPDYYPGDTYEEDAPLLLYAVWIENQCDFSVYALTITPNTVKPNQTITVRYKVASHDKYFSYTKVPVDVLIDGKQINRFNVVLEAEEVWNITFDLNVGSTAGERKIEIRINWADKNQETDDSNNSVTAYFTVLQEEYELSVDVVEPNADYIIGHDVITSYIVRNDGNTDLTPESGAHAWFTVYYMNGAQKTVVHTQSKSVIVPMEQSNLIYFKWTVPETIPSGTTVYCRCELDPDNLLHESEREDNMTELSRKAVSAQSGQTPDTHYAGSKPLGCTKADLPQETEGSASWTVWEYISGEFVLKKYGIRVSGTPVISPGSNCSTAEYTDGAWSMKSGYGITVSYSPAIAVLSGYSSPASDAYTGIQEVKAVFPEYNYQYADSQFRTMENTGGMWSFVLNENADNCERLHFIPVWYDNGEYVVSVTANGLWTPAGMISAVRNSNTVYIFGTLFDDWYQS